MTFTAVSLGIEKTKGLARIFRYRTVSHSDGLQCK